MARPRKNPNDPKWTKECGRCGKTLSGDGIHTCTPKEIMQFESKPDDWKMYFSAALTGLIARGGLPSDQMIKTAKQYADDVITQL